MNKQTQTHSYKKQKQERIESFLTLLVRVSFNIYVRHYISNKMSSSSVKYTLYKNPVELETLAMVRYLFTQDAILLPTVIIERGHPPGIQLPSIYDHNKNELYEGIQGCVQFYESQSGISDVLTKAQTFASEHPSFRIYEGVTPR